MHPRRAMPLAIAAMALFVVALLAAKLGVPEYSQRVHPVGMRGAIGLPWAFAFNLLAFVLPAACLLLASIRMRARLEGAGWLARIGLVLAQLSAIAFGAQGLLPMDLQEQDAFSTRLHAVAWMLWWIAFVPAALFLGAGARRGWWFAIAGIALGLLLPVIAVLAPIGHWVGLAQRVAFALWFGWWLLAGLALGTGSRSVASAAR